MAAWFSSLGIHSHWFSGLLVPLCEHGSVQTLVKILLQVNHIPVRGAISK